MAPVNKLEYFPPLDQCLSGGQILPSWKAIFAVVAELVEINAGRQAINVVHLTDDLQKVRGFLATSKIMDLMAEVTFEDLLRKPWTAFPPPNASSKSAFDTKTAAINVTSVANGKFDLAEIKDDALYLSQFLKIHELSALRIVVQEFQSRPRDELLLGLREEEAASLSNIMGTSSSLSMGVQILRLAKSEEEYKRFASNDGRRDRQARTCLSEREYLLRTSGLLYQLSLHHERTKGQGIVDGIENQFLASLGDFLSLTSVDCEADDEYLMGFLNALGSKIDELSKDNQSAEDHRLGVEYAESIMTESVCYMEIIFQFLDSAVALPTSQVVLRWFQIFAPYDFLDLFSSQHGSLLWIVDHMKCLIAVISLTILKVGKAVDYLKNPQNALDSGSQVSSPCYLLDDDAILAIHNYLFECATAQLRVMCPTVFAWALLLRTMEEATELFEASSDNGSESESSVTQQGEAFGSRGQKSFDRELPPQLARFQEILEKISASSVVDDPIRFMAETVSKAGNGDEDNGAGGSLLLDYLTALGLLVGKFDKDGSSGVIGPRMRAVILDLISQGVSKMLYNNSLVSASLAALAGGRQYWDLLEVPKLADNEDPSLRFFRDPMLMNGLFEMSAQRQPYERAPFLKFALALAACRAPDSDGDPAGGTILDERASFTHVLEQGFRNFETKQEEDNSNLIALTQPLHIFEDRRAGKLLSIADGSGGSSSDNFTIPAGTNGCVVSEDDSEPKVVIWFHPYSGYSYLGKLLETFLNNSDVFEAIGEPVDEESVADIIDIFATLLLSCKNLDQPRAAATYVLGRASEGLSRTRNITNVILDIFEQDLDNRSGNPGRFQFLGISTSSVHFLHALLPFEPARVWPFLARSRFLDTDGRGSRLSEIVAGVEIVTGRFDLLLSSIRLFDALVEDSVSRAVSRKGGASTSLLRYVSPQNLGPGIPEPGLIRVINHFTSVLIDVFSSIHNWKMEDPEQYLHLFQVIGTTFSNIISYVYGIDNSQESQINSKLVGNLTLAAKLIVDSFLSTTPGNLQVQVILHSFAEGYYTNSVELHPSLLTLSRSRTAATFRLTISLLRLRSMLELPPSQLEIQLFSAVALFVRLYAAHESYKPLVLTLLKELVSGASDHVGEPPSLLGHLRPETSKGFLAMLTDLDGPTESEKQVNLIWELFSAVVSNRQRTLAIIILTGQTPRQALKNTNAPPVLENSFLSIALDNISRLDFNVARSKLDPPPPAMAMLEFVAQAQDFWPLQMGKLQSHPNFVRTISEWVENLEPPGDPERAGEQQQLEWCYHLRMASYIAEIIAMYLFRCRELGEMGPVKEIIPRLRFFKTHAVTVPCYNASLHGNFQENFEKKCPKLNPLVLKKSRLGKRTLGANYFYDIVLSDKMLNHDEGWKGTKENGLFHEFIRTNINLSMVDAQIALLHGWKFLAIELRNSVSREPDLQRLFAKITTECLVANNNNKKQPPEHIFDRLMQTRTDFALMAMQTILDTQSKKQLAVGAAPAVKLILSYVWRTIQTHRETLDLAISVGDAQYYRSLLKLLYLALQANTVPTDGSTNTASSTIKPSVSEEILIALAVTNHVVARGFREMAVAIHDRAADCSPEDVFLLTNILAACLRIPNIGFCHDQIIKHMVNSEAARVAVTLFSWSDRLAIDGDPIYGELSIGFLVELSSMKAMAEHIAVEGALSQISSAGLANYLRRGNVSPFAEGVGPQRCYDIWVRGILPLLLNLLYSVGSLIGIEIAVFLNQFTPLLQNSLRGLETNDSSRNMSGMVLKPVISRVVSEINTLALINHILKEYRISLAGTTEIPEVPGLAPLDGSAVLENAEFWLASRQLLRERIMPMGQKELELSKQKALSKDHGCVNRLEERIVEELMGIRDILTPVNGDA